MKPLIELPPEVIRALRGVVFDIDDTLTRGGRLELEAFSALWTLHRAGLRLVAVTGRPLGWVDVVARQWPVDIAVGENGAGWVARAENEIIEGYFEDEHERGRARSRLTALRLDVQRALPHVRVTADDRARRCDLAFDVGELEVVSPADVTRLVGLIEAARMHASVSSVHCHAATGAWNKALGVERALAACLGSQLDAERERWLFVGDSGNDAAAFAAFPVSVGVANVVEHLSRLPVPPRYVTKTDRGLGFAELAAQILEARE